MANLPVIIGPLATLTVNPGLPTASPWLDGQMEAHPFEAKLGFPGPNHPRLIDRDPRILGPIGFLQPPPRPAGLNPGRPADRPESSPDSNQASGDQPDHPRKSIVEAKILVNGQSTPELAFADQSNGSVTVFLNNQVVFQVGGLSHPEGVNLADIDNDGTPDLLVADSGNDRVLIYRGLAGGGFGPELMGGNGVTVGDDPVSLTVGDTDGDRLADLIVSNKESNTVSILKGRGLGLNWSLGPAFDIRAGAAPVQTLLILPGSGETDVRLLICNKGSNNVFRYEAEPGARLGDQPPQIIDVGAGPDAMLAGYFDHRPNLDLLTVNSEAKSLTYIGDVFTAHSTRQEITAPGFHPLLAIPLTIDNSGISDLIVANTDGRITFLQAGDNGLQLTGMVTPMALTNLTAITAGSWTSGGLALYEASSDFDSIAMLRFTLDELTSTENSPELAVPTSGIATNSTENIDVEIVPIGGLSTDVAGVLWIRTPDIGSSDITQAARDVKGSHRAIQAAGQRHDEVDLDSEVEPSRSSEDDFLDEDPSAGWTRYVLGLDAAIGSFAGEVAALAAADTTDPVDDWLIDFHATRRFAVRESIHDSSDPFDQPIHESARSNTPRPISFTDADAVASDNPQLATATIGLALAVRLLVKTSPPRPPRLRPGQSPQGRFNPWPEVFPLTLLVNKGRVIRSRRSRK